MSPPLCHVTSDIVTASLQRVPYTLCILSLFRERPSVNSILKKPFIQKKVSKFLPEHVSVILHLFCKLAMTV